MNSVLASASYVVLVPVACSVNAQAIQVIDQDRFVRVDSQTTTSPTPFGPFDASESASFPVGSAGEITVVASQLSEFEGDVWAGQGSITLSGASPDASNLAFYQAQTFQRIDFEVTQPIDANLVASADFETGVEIEGDVALIDITGGGFNVVAAVAGFTTPGGGIDVDVTLPIGTYRLVAFVDALSTNDQIATAPNSFGYSFEFTIPAPATAVTLGAVGLLAAGRRRRL